ncbi:uncharacterized protein LOC131618653, partial [Vicia villosa]|uniref:uncharacterized protein LOC131618653 n=1 Tax=Vicia villosa TaxID=3911 RepID=UPI00273C571F
LLVQVSFCCWVHLFPLSSEENTFRRKFDREEDLERAREHERQEEEGRAKPKGKGPPVQRKPLKHRDFEVNLESRLGKTQVVTPVAPLSQQVKCLHVLRIKVRVLRKFVAKGYK